MNNVAVILAAGSGTRMKSDKSKLLLEINGKTVIERTVKAFSKISEIDEIIVVIRESDLNEFEKHLSKYDLSYCFGGATRQESVMNAVETIDECDLIIIHDGARPLVTEKEITDTINKAKETGAAAVGVTPKDTIKIVDENLQIVGTPDRSNLISIRTPQVFDFSQYLKAVDLAKKQGKDFTDDCRLVENLGRKVNVVIGEYTNIKITTPEDIPMAESILTMRGEK
ncbi:MAG: 2-C-methyl-D-erythritol 4-phosphate cytidylyltransferase [Eubacteriales bacterium]|nr:2-C-methyl-D-erythritol 4-phosphate cytidylyltransferase [Eubacteriales bacterium]